MVLREHDSHIEDLFGGREEGHVSVDPPCYDNIAITRFLNYVSNFAHLALYRHKQPRQ
jgi:hypothetical protein